MNPDPIAKLAHFSPARTTDPVELLFAAGRASARTHWGWKAAVAALVASNAALGAVLLLHPPNGLPVSAPDPAPVVPPRSEPVPPPPSTRPPDDEPWSYRALRGADLERAPEPETLANVAPHEPLSVLSGRRGDID